MAEAERPTLAVLPAPDLPSSRSARLGMVGDAQLLASTLFTTQVCPAATVPERPSQTSTVVARC